MHYGPLIFTNIIVCAKNVKTFNWWLREERSSIVTPLTTRQALLACKFSVDFASSAAAQEQCTQKKQHLKGANKKESANMRSWAHHEKKRYLEPKKLLLKAMLFLILFATLLVVIIWLETLVTSKKKE
jgi:hypothetical protein